MSSPLQSPAAPPKRSTTVFWLVVLVCIAPVAASYFLYYGVRPEGRTNYGTLLNPQIAVAATATTPLVRANQESGFVDFLSALPQDNPRLALASLGDFRGRWLLVRVGPSSCDEDCLRQLYVMRQLRLTTGRERDRVERLWLVTDAGTPAAQSLADYAGTWVLSVPKADTDLWPREIPIQPASAAMATVPTAGHLWLIDPLGNLMMRFPLDPDPAKMKKDLMKLLKASRVG
ncbi:MAG: SCO family protein [Burkholderiaceae bacterium]